VLGDLEARIPAHGIDRPLEPAVAEGLDAAAGPADDVVVMATARVEPLVAGRVAPEIDPLHQAQLLQLVESAVDARPSNPVELTVDLERQIVEDESGLSVPFKVGEFQRYCLLEGLDDIGLTLRYEDLIREYEIRRG